MELAIGVTFPFFVDVGVDFGRREVGVSEQILYDPQVGTAFKHVGGEAVAEKVRIDVFRNPRKQGRALDDPEHGLAAESSPPV